VIKYTVALRDRLSFHVDTYYVTGYKEGMIRNIRHRGLRALYEENDPTGVNPQWAKRLQILLTRLEASTKPSDMALPGLRLHPLRGNLRGFWAVNISGNWRMVFRFVGEDVVDVDLIDYH
jgi:toxin HigB-1